MNTIKTFLKAQEEIISKYIYVSFFAVALGFMLQVAHAWIEPTLAPPGANAPAPLNESNVGQEKIGGLLLNTGGAGTGLIVDKGSVGIGTQNPLAKLDVAGSLRFGTGGGLLYSIPVGDYGGKTTVLQVADGKGGPNDEIIIGPNGSGQVGVGYQGHIVLDAANILLNNGGAKTFTFTNGNVGVGTVNPSAKLSLLGNIQIKDGSEKDGRVLTSDPNGVASWKDPVGGGGSGGGAQVLSGHGVVTGSAGASECTGTYLSGFCRGQYFKDIVFSTPFTTIPHVIVAPEVLIDAAQAPCTGGSTDKVVAYPDNITTTGFRLVAYGSPGGGSCGANEGDAVRAKAGWIAVAGSGGSGGSGRKILSGTVSPRISNGNTHSEMGRVSFGSACTNPKIVTQSVLDSAFCGTTIGRKQCSNNPSSQSQDIHSYFGNVTATGFDTYISATDGIYVGASQAFPINWIATCD